MLAKIITLCAKLYSTSLGLYVCFKSKVYIAYGKENASAGDLVIFACSIDDSSYISCGLKPGSCSFGFSGLLSELFRVALAKIELSHMFSNNNDHLTTTV